MWGVVFNNGLKCVDNGWWVYVYMILRFWKGRGDLLRFRDFGCFCVFDFCFDSGDDFEDWVIWGGGVIFSGLNFSCIFVK